MAIYENNLQTKSNWLIHVAIKNFIGTTVTDTKNNKQKLECIYTL